MAKKGKTSGKRDKARERRERRFEPRPLTSATVVYLVGAIGALVMGAGAWGQFGAMLHEGGPPPLEIAPYILAAGALVVGVAIWIGTSGEAALRVGDAGVGIEKRGLRRVPWHAVERIEWRMETLHVRGKDEAGLDATLAVPLKVNPQAIAWVLKEARERIPAAVDVPEDATIPEPLASAGEKLALEPPQLVGKRCAASGKVIAYEPDARLCPRCERVYHKSSVPEACECGASLADLRPSAKAS